MKKMTRCMECNFDSCSSDMLFVIKDGVKIVCPCSICLVKMICNKDCDELDNYLKLYYYSNYE